MLKLPLFEVFGTAMSGVIYHSHSKYLDDKVSPYFVVTLGARYTFSGKISVFAEIGNTETAFLNGGLCFSF